MKKTTMYILLCTTILIPGISLAMNDTPMTPVSKVKQQMATIPQTPPLNEFAKKYNPNVYSPDTADFYAKQDRAEASGKNKMVKMQLQMQVENLEFKKNLAKAVEEETTLREKLLEEKRQELRKAEQKAQTEKDDLDQQMEAARLREEDTERQLKELTSQIETLKLEVEKANSEKEEASTAAKVQREQKVAIRELATQQLGKRDQKIIELEAEAENMRTKLHQEKIISEKLRLQKQTLAELQAVKSSGSTIKQQGDSSKKLVPEMPTDSEVKQQSQNNTIPVGSSQQEGSPANEGSRDSQNTISTTNPTGTKAKMKRELGSENKSNF